MYKRQAGADVNRARMNDGSTPLTLVAQRSDHRIDDTAALGIVQLLAMAGANLAHRTELDETATAIAARTNKPLTAAWLGSVAELSPVQICVALGKAEALRTLLQWHECDPFARAPGTPVLADLAAVHGPPLLRLCREVRSKWAPARHGLFHPAHRSTVMCVLLVARCGPCLLYTSPSPRDGLLSRMPSSA